MEKKYLALPFSFKNIEEDDEFYRFSGYASTFDNVDLGMDKIMPGAFDNTIKTKSANQIKLLYQHDMKMPLGVFDEVRADKNGLYVNARMPKDHSQVKDVMALMKCGALNSMSIGFIPKEWDYDEQNIRSLKDVDLHEISLVTMPMNPKAQITSFKSIGASRTLPLAEESKAWDAKAAVVRVRRFTDSEEKPSASYKKAFMYYDGEDAENFTAYKLPFADVVDGKLMAIPRAIYAVAAVLDGGRGGVKIPDSDKEKIKGIVDGYYKKMDKESPFKKADTFEDEDEDWWDKEDPEDESDDKQTIAEDEEEDDIIPKKRRKKKFYVEDVRNVNTKRAFERLLRDSGSFSAQAAIKLASYFVNSSESKSNETKEIANKFKELVDLIKK